MAKTDRLAGLLFSRRGFIIPAIFLSGGCYYFSVGLQNNYWWLIWLAPIPILLISLEVSGPRAFLFAFLAYLIGRISWIPYLLSVVPVPLSIAFTLLLPLIFALIIVACRKIVLKSGHWVSFFAFPVLVTSWEYLFFLLSRDGTAGSLAYSQSNFLPLIQIASVTGLLGITFFICLFPSFIAGIIYFRNQRRARTVLGTLLLFSLILVLGFGFARIKSAAPEQTLRIGMIVMNESIYEGPDSPAGQRAAQVQQWYASQISDMANKGIQVVLLPEKILATDSYGIMNLLVKAAGNSNMALVAGYEWDSGGHKLNRSIYANLYGVINQYTKVNLYEGELYEGFVPGNKLGLIDISNNSTGMVICKDMDFHRYIREYKEASILFVPAWDFVADDWLHSRMAILRGVENGFSIARNARQGRLTLSDCTGRVLAESSSADGMEHVLIGKLPTKRVHTFFSKTGDWFGLFNLLAASVFLFIWPVRRTRK
ncbi:MAG: hypothetical protein ACHQEM_05025 [Chitinophagales bacterium]